MKCPCCNKEFDAKPYKQQNVETYNESAIIRTICCDQLVEMFPIRSVRLEAYSGIKTEDDWGN